MKKFFKSVLPLAIAATAAVTMTGNALAADWKPKKPVEFIIMAGTGGGADQIARLLQGLIEKKNLSPRPLFRSTSQVVQVRKHCAICRIKKVMITLCWLH